MDFFSALSIFISENLTFIAIYTETLELEVSEMLAHLQKEVQFAPVVSFQFLIFVNWLELY